MLPGDVTVETAHIFSLELVTLLTEELNDAPPILGHKAEKWKVIVVVHR